MTLIPEAETRLRKYIKDYEDAPKWGGPTMYPPAPSVDDLKLLLEALTTPHMPEGEVERIIRNVFREGARTGSPTGNMVFPSAEEDMWKRVRAALTTRPIAVAASGSASDALAERLMQDFYLSSSYNPNAARPADNVKAAIAFTLGQQQVDGRTRRLVIAAREVAFGGCTEDASQELDEASEAFADDVPWDDTPALADEESFRAGYAEGAEHGMDYHDFGTSDSGDGESHVDKAWKEYAASRATEA